MTCRIYLATGAHHDVPDGRPAPQIGPSGVLIVHEFGRRITYAPHAWTRLIEDSEFEDPMP